MKRAALIAAVIAAGLVVFVPTDRHIGNRRAQRPPEQTSEAVPPAPASEAPPEPPTQPGTIRGKVVLIGSERVPKTVTGKLDGLGRPLAFRATAGRFEIEARPGTYLLSDVEVDGTRLDFLDQVVIDASGYVELRIPDIVKITGTVFVPPGWKRWMSVKFVGADDSTCGVDYYPTLSGRIGGGDGPSDPGPVLFETAPLPAGRYVLKVGPWAQWYTASERDSHVDLFLPPPVTIHVSVVDEHGHDLGAEAGVDWYVPPLDDLVVGELLPERKDGRFSFQAPRGRVTVSARAPRFLRTEETFEFPGDRDVTLTLKPAAIVVVGIRIDGMLSDGTGFSIEAEGGSLHCYGSAGGATFDLPTGTYRIKLTETPGCEPPQPVDVQAVEGELREVWFDLKRNR